MPYIRIPGIEGLVWDPEEVPRSMKKHDCGDCFSCQWCSDESCRVCLRQKKNCCRNRAEGEK